MRNASTYLDPGELDEQLDNSRRSLPNEYGWLPREFCGARSLDEARRDLLCIANADIPTNHVNLSVDPDDGARSSARGWLRAPGPGQQQLVVLLNGSPAFTFDRREFRGAWLPTNGQTSLTGRLRASSDADTIDVMLDDACAIRLTRQNFRGAWRASANDFPKDLRFVIDVDLGRGHRGPQIRGDTHA